MGLKKALSEKRMNTPAPQSESLRDACAKCGRSKFKTEGTLCFWCRKEATVAKTSLEDFCIDTPAMRFHPGLVRIIAREFGLDMNRIQDGWMKVNLGVR
jgi:hypothetical protein